MLGPYSEEMTNERLSLIGKWRWLSFECYAEFREKEAKKTKARSFRRMEKQVKGNRENPEDFDQDHIMGWNKEARIRIRSILSQFGKGSMAALYKRRFGHLRGVWLSSRNPSHHLHKSKTREIVAVHIGATTPTCDAGRVDDIGRGVVSVDVQWSGRTVIIINIMWALMLKGRLFHGIDRLRGCTFHWIGLPQLFFHLHRVSSDNDL